MHNELNNPQVERERGGEREGEERERVRKERERLRKERERVRKERDRVRGS